MTERQRNDLGEGAAILLALVPLSDKQRHAVVGHELRGLTFEELGAERGVDRTVIFAARKQGLARMASMLAPLAERLLAA